MALEDDLLAGYGASRLGLRLAGCCVHRTCSPRMARNCAGGDGCRSPAACLELDRHAEPALTHRAILPLTYQLPDQPDSFRQRHRRDLFRHFDIAKGDPNVDRHERCAGNGLALGSPSQPVLAKPSDTFGLAPGDQLGVGSRGSAEAFPAYG